MRDYGPSRYETSISYSSFIHILCKKLGLKSFISMRYGARKNRMKPYMRFKELFVDATSEKRNHRHVKFGFIYIIDEVDKHLFCPAVAKIVDEKKYLFQFCITPSAVTCRMPETSTLSVLDAPYPLPYKARNQPHQHRLKSP